AGCVVDWKGKPCPFPNTMEAIEGGGIDIPKDRPGGTIYCPIGTTQEQPCRGTNGRDNIEGTTSGDWIEALDGDDTIYAGSGIDSIRSGAGSDTIYSDAGTDYITAGPGNETYMVDMAMTC
ncbi:MAG TPA: hypothetical protein VFG77_02400, partial [Nitrososphaeraceae archaeon]|nr:hypothetical protein [Nitrososphaeraceae archaeon]